jgi:membrane protein DedA with SNARE-associated domain
MVLESFLQQMIELIAEHGVLAVMAGMVIEEVFVPIPSPAIPMAAGFLLIDAATISAAFFQILFYIAIPASIASVVSSYFVYSIAYYGGEPIVRKYGRYLDLSWEEIQQFESHFVDTDNEKYFVAIFRAIPIVPLSLVSGSSGLFKMDWKQYGLWSFIGMLPRNFILAYIGWSVKDDFMAIASQIDSVSTAVALIVAFTVGGFIGYRKTKDLYKRFL